MRAAVQAAPAPGLRPEQRVPRHLQRLVQVPELLHLPVLRAAGRVSRDLEVAQGPPDGRPAEIQGQGQGARGTAHDAPTTVGILLGVAGARIGMVRITR